MTWDATGRELPGEIVLAGAELTLAIDDREAVYPLTIDPVTGDTLNPWFDITASDSTFLVTADIPDFPGDPDLVVLRVTVEGWREGHEIKTVLEVMDFEDERTGFSAMRTWIPRCSSSATRSAACWVKRG